MRAVGTVIVAAGILAVVAALGVRPSVRQELAGIGLAGVMTGLMVLLLGNYLRHAAAQAAACRGPAQPSSVPTTETNDTISPG